MSEKAAGRQRGAGGKVLWPIIITLVILTTGGLAAAWMNGGGRVVNYGPVVPVTRGDLTISVTESGTLRHRDQTIVANEVEGRTTILWIVDEGTEVEAGDLLVELDSSDMEDRLIEREISVQNARAAFIRAQQELEVTKSRTASEIETTELAYRFAKLDLARYTGVDELADADLDLAQVEAMVARLMQQPDELTVSPGAATEDEDVEPLQEELTELDGVSAEQAVQIIQARQARATRQGEYAQEQERLRSNIDLAAEELTRAQQRHEDSERLFQQGFVSQLEVEGDRLAYERADVDHRLAQGQLRLFERYTHRRDLEQYASDVRQAYAALQRTQMRAEADIVQAEADYDAREQELQRQERQLARLKEQIEKSTIIAPVGGTVVYETSANPGRWGNREPLEAGQEVREREELIYLPASGGMIAEIQVHESALNRIAVGMPVRVTVEAGPRDIFPGTVRRIAPMPDATSRWMNPDLITYSTQVAINTSEDLRTGMRAQTQIIVDELRDVLYVPVQAIVRRGRQHYAYVVTPDGPQPREVEIGMDDMRYVHVISGLEEGEQVLLAPPLRSDDDAGRRQEAEDADEQRDTEEQTQAEPPAPMGEQPAPAETLVPADEGGSGGGRGGGRGGGGGGDGAGGGRGR
ncbi:MAG: efflux RND transporter periplasmic adaptor subunit [Phycisphaeraceae bacterium]